jgi:cyclic beta-1,2-glucan synthetase
LDEGRLIVDPRLPRHWKGFEAEMRGPSGSIRVQVEDPAGQGGGAVGLKVDGKPHEGPVAFPTDGSTRLVEVKISAQVEYSD